MFLTPSLKLDKVEMDGIGQVVLGLRLRNPKESKHQHSIQFVEIVETRDWMCPIRTYKALVDLLGRRRSNLTSFCETEAGSLISRKWINKLLKTFLGGHAGYLGGKLSSHSFRAGLATAQAGVRGHK